MQNVFFAEFFLKRSFEKFNARDYRKADVYEYRKIITRIKVTSIFFVHRNSCVSCH